MSIQHQVWQRELPVTTALLAQIFSDLQEQLSKPGFPVVLKGHFPEEVSGTRFEIKQYEVEWTLAMVGTYINRVRLDCSHHNVHLGALEMLLRENGFTQLD